jgi:hypothetical protein
MEGKVSGAEWAACHARKLMLVATALMLIPVSTVGQTWQWSTETVDTSGVQTSIAVDKDQNLHLSYFSGGFKYAFRPANSSHWFNMNVAAGGGYTEAFTRMTIDDAGNPSICFTPGILNYASFEKRGWNIQQIDPQAGLIDYSCSLAIAPNGTRHVLWYQYGGPGGGYYLHLKHAVLTNGAWVARTVDFEGQTGKWNSLVLDAQGNPHVSYDSFLKGQLKYAYWDGKEWKHTVVDSPAISADGANSHGLGSSLVLNREGKAQISYETDTTLKYATEKDGAWKIETLDSVTVSGSWMGFRTRQALDPQGNAHIVYEDAGRVKHAYWDGAKWNIQVVSGAGLRTHRFESIAIDREGNIYISYQDASDGSVKVAIGRLEKSAPNSAAEKMGNK